VWPFIVGGVVGAACLLALLFTIAAYYVWRSRRCSPSPSPSPHPGHRKIPVISGPLELLPLPYVQDNSVPFTRRELTSYLEPSRPESDFENEELYVNSDAIRDNCMQHQYVNIRREGGRHEDSPSHSHSGDNHPAVVHARDRRPKSVFPSEYLPPPPPAPVGHRRLVYKQNALSIVPSDQTDSIYINTSRL